MRKIYLICIIAAFVVFETVTIPSAASETAVEDDETAVYYVVVTHTGKKYDLLRSTMKQMSKALRIPIDTMGRTYNAEKDLIALPDNDEDEIYAGDYYPRRSPSEFLSLEYLDFYQPKAEKNTIALVAGIYETKKEADRVLKKIKKHAKKAYVLKAEVYIGCMH